MRRILFVQRAEWRHLLRALLRQCSYLPDPVARRYMHDHVLHRFRDRTRQYYKNKNNFTPLLQLRLRRTARHFLSLLTRANEGYTKTLERVLLLSYGRIGRRRHELLSLLLKPTAPPNTEVLEALVTDSRHFGDTWTPPPVLVELLKAQKQSPIVLQRGLRPMVKTFEPKIPKENSWGRPMPKCRQRNMRLRWYRNALDSALPPITPADMKTLDELISGKTPWKLPPRRTPIKDQLTVSKSLLTPQFLLEGPPKGETFEKYKDGRPHHITKRFMQRLWDRINCLIPRTEENNHQNQPVFSFPLPKARVDGVVSLAGTKGEGLFDGVDEKGRRIRQPTTVSPSTPPIENTVT